MTTAAINTKESMKLFTNPVWDLILPYLTLADLESVSQSHPELRKIVVSYLARRHPLTIDKETLWKYPIELYGPLYMRYGSQATNTVIDGVFEYDIDRLFELFPKIHQLTMRNVEHISCNNLHSYPTSIRKLCLINNTIKHNNQWMSGMDCLESLFLQGNNTMKINTKNLKSLTLINQNYDLDSHNRLCENLGELTIDTWDRMLCISRLRYLERFRVIQSVDPRNQKRLEEGLNETSRDIHYFDIPTKETPILGLNEYCLLHLQRFLGEEDCISLRDSHPVFEILKISKFTIKPFTLERRPLLKHYELYERICAGVSELILDDIRSKDICRLLPLISDGLRKLTLEEVRVPEDEFRNFLGRVNASLSSLSIYKVDEKVTDSLQGLQNIRELKIERTKLTDEVLWILDVNKRNLRRLKVDLFEEHLLCVDEAELWRVIVQMENLVELDINLERPVAKIPTVGNGLLPKLEKLTLIFDPRELLRCLDGAALKELLIMRTDGDEEIVWFEGLKKLRISPKKGEDLVAIVRGLPQLVELILLCSCTPVEKLIELRSYLQRNRRDLKIKME